MTLVFSGVHKSFGDLEVVAGFDSQVGAGELLALVGPSGCGKSTLLHLAAGLERPSAGQVLFESAPVTAPAPKRMLMFQENALYPWLSLQRNVALALELQKVDKRSAREQAALWLEKVQLIDFKDYYPHQVSGGMRQRCALARAFISSPQVLLLDEPFGALDALTRLSLQDVLLKLILEQRPTVLLVTHDVDEALFLADRVLVFSPRPARVLQEFKVQKTAAGHDLSELARMRKEILSLLGIDTHSGNDQKNSPNEVLAA